MAICAREPPGHHSAQPSVLGIIHADECPPHRPALAGGHAGVWMVGTFGVAADPRVAEQRARGE